jgi:hypothetical protein
MKIGDSHGSRGQNFTGDIFLQNFKNRGPGGLPPTRVRILTDEFCHQNDVILMKSAKTLLLKLTFLTGDKTRIKTRECFRVLYYE